MRIKQETVIKFSEERLPEGKKKEVKRVTFEQVRLIGKNLHYSLKLKGVSHAQIAGFFIEEAKEEYSIREVADRLRRFPFAMEREEEALLLARYVVEDSGEGFFLEDMETCQSACIIRSILAKLIGEIRVYSREEAEQLRLRVGRVMSRFGKLVQQFLDFSQQGTREQMLRKTTREGDKAQLVSKEKMEEALENSLSSLQSEDFLHEEIDFTIFYLFSWSRNLNELEVTRLLTMLEQDLNW